ncbi:MAG: hypothetical protein E6K19_07050 [Methanobacteriota archaeon]|nr:MAG: hypothetical protein E6K19_07050 [Euryarchaeota archaeon]
MRTDQTHSNSRVNAGVLEAFLAHISIRRVEGAEADDLLVEVQKWWDCDVPFGPSPEIAVLSAYANGPGHGSVRIGTHRANAGGRS